MADYIYLIENRLTPAQFSALRTVRDVVRSKGMNLFLVGGAVRDLTSGITVRDLDIAVQGNPLKLRKDLEKAGATVLGESAELQALYLAMPGGVRLELGATLTQAFPKPGKPVYKPAAILDDLRRRDFTVNAMAVSLNDGSYGLLMDPLNGIADLENRELRLVSNYGFIEDPSRMIRGVRLSARLGLVFEAKTQQRYETGKSEGYISALSAWHKAYELEEIFHEEDPLRVMRRLESEGWLKTLSPALNPAKVNEAELTRMRDTADQLELMGIHADSSAANFIVLTAKLQPKDISALKKAFARPGFADQIAALEGTAKAFLAQFTAKTAQAPSDAWKLLYSSEPEPILWLAHTSKSAPVQARFKAFFEDWSQARNRIPYQTMLEMRITPELPAYNELLDKLFFAIMDGKLDTPEALKAFLEPYSPPAPPPPVSMRRRPKREARPPKAPKAPKAPAVKPEAAQPVEVTAAADTPAKPAAAQKPEPAKKAEPAKRPEPPKPAAKKAEPAKAAVAKKPEPPKAAAKKPAAKAPAKKVVPTRKPATKKPTPKPVAKKAAPAKKVIAKKPAHKPVAKKSPAKKAPAKAIKKPAAKKPIAKKVPAKKPAKKR